MILFFLIIPNKPHTITNKHGYRDGEYRSTMQQKNKLTSAVLSEIGVETSLFVDPFKVIISYQISPKSHHFIPNFP